jgi:hypothetical protein
LSIEFSNYQWIREILAIKLCFLNRKGISFVGKLLVTGYQLLAIRLALIVSLNGYLKTQIYRNLRQPITNYQ